MINEYNSKLTNETALRETLHKIISSSVGIHFVQSKDQIFRGSGVHIGGGLILTVQHALTPNEPSGRIIVNHEDNQWSANIIEAINGLDLLLLQIKQFNNNLQTVKVHEQVEYAFQPGEVLFYTPYYPQRRVLAGRFVGRDIEYIKEDNPELDPFPRFPQYNFVIGTQIRLAPGNSGSGVFNLQGDLVGTIRSCAQALDQNHNPIFPIALGVSSTALKEFGR